MPLEQAIDRALAAAEAAPPAVPAPTRRPEGESTLLTAREREVAALVAQGLTNKQIADQLVISERTADNHVGHILDKLGFTSRAQVAAWAAEQRLADTWMEERR
jgi:DNA-binding NarL/FixJ family response regulator